MSEATSLALLNKAGQRLFAFGLSGKAVLRYAAILPLEERLAYVTEALRHFKRVLSLGVTWKCPPVDVRTFIESPEFANQRDEVYPKIMDELVEMNDGTYVEVVLTGAIGSGKTDTALRCQLYQLYVLSCIHNPQRLFRLAPSSEILIVFQSINASHSKGLDFARFKSMIDASPYFQNVFSYNTGLSSELHFPNRIEVIPMSGNPQAAIGRNVIGGVIDECLVGDTQIATPTGTVAIKDVRAGMKVLSVGKAGQIREDVVVHARNNGVKEVFQIALDTGQVILGVTRNHPIATSKGWTAVGDLSIGDWVYARAERSGGLHFMAGKAEVAPQTGPHSREDREAHRHLVGKTPGSRSILHAEAAHQAAPRGKGDSYREEAQTFESARIGYQLDARDASRALRFQSTALGDRRSTPHTRPGGAGESLEGPRRLEALPRHEEAAVNCTCEIPAVGWEVRARMFFRKLEDDAFRGLAALFVGASRGEVVGSGEGGGSIFLRGSRDPVHHRQDPEADFAGFPGPIRDRASWHAGSQVEMGGQEADGETGSDEPVCPGEWVDVRGLDRGRVVSVTQVGEAEVFNFETHETHTYIANGIVTHNCNFFAKVEQSKNAADGGFYDQALEMYNSIVRRRKSRFLIKGKMFGLLCLVSSKRYPGEFTEQKAEEARKQLAATGSTDIYVYDRRLWEVKPDDTYCGEWFNVFVGDPNHKPRIMDEGEEPRPDSRHLVLAVPIEFRSEFDRDLLSAIRDIGGMSTLALHPFILDTDAVGEAFDKVPSVLSREECDFVETKVLIYPERFVNPKEPRFAHVDLGLSNDSAGVAVGHIEKFIEMSRGGWSETLPLIRYDLLLEVRPPRHGEIEFAKIRALFYKLRELRMNLKWISFDTFQSIDSMQILSQQGFVTGKCSMDTDPACYDLFKTALYDRRVQAPLHPKAQKEIIRLERDPKTGKVDHPADGSKDVADAMAGVTYGLTMRRELWLRHGIPITKVPSYLLKGQDKAGGSDEKRMADQERLAA